MDLIRAFTEHPASVGESYTEHLVRAVCFGTRMVLAGIACLLHGLLPFVFVRTGSQAITERFTSIAPQLSFNFGGKRGWSYLSGGIGPSTWSVVPDGSAPLAVDEVVGAADPAGCGLGGGWRDRDEERGRGAEGGVLHHVPGP